MGGVLAGVRANRGRPATRERHSISGPRQTDKPNREAEQGNAEIHKREEF